MPELPEVETIANQLKPALVGKTFKEVRINWKGSIQGNITEFRESLIDQTIKKVKRRGKYICISLTNGQILTIHLGMSGKLLINEDKNKQKYLRIEFVLNQDFSLNFIDMRKFGKIKIWQADEPLLPLLGPEPLDPGTIHQTLESLKTTRVIKSVLVDQKILAGIGNIYADEALFQARIHPLFPKNHLESVKIRHLSEAIPQILRNAIINMGTTISQYRPPNYSQGENQFFLKVYGQKDKPCNTCGTMINRIRINGRSSHFCPKCQPLADPVT
jgi:formamidopyrimidine-DNA glycosylase